MGRQQLREIGKTHSHGVSWSSRARGWALTQLTHEHWDIYRRILADQNASGRYVRPQSRARAILGRIYADRLRELYEKELTRLLSLPVPDRVSRNPKYMHLRPRQSGKS